MNANTRCVIKYTSDNAFGSTVYFYYNTKPAILIQPTMEMAWMEVQLLLFTIKTTV